MRRTRSERVQVDVDHQRRGVVAGAREDLALRAAGEAVAPEGDARGRAGRVGLKADAVAGQHGQAVGHGMAALHGLPGVLLAPLLGFRILRGAADGGRVQQQVGAGERHQARGLRVPLVPAHQHAEPADRGLDRPQVVVARREKELLVVRRIVRDVGLAVAARRGCRPPRAPPRCCGTGRPRAARTASRRSPRTIPWRARRARPCRGRESAPRGRTGRVLHLAEVAALVQFLQQHQARAARRRRRECPVRSVRGSRPGRRRPRAGPARP
jgi:hypothetical protein